MRLPSTRDARTRPDARVPKDGGRVSTGRGGGAHIGIRATNRRPVAAGQSCCRRASRRRPSGRSALPVRWQGACFARAGPRSRYSGPGTSKRSMLRPRGSSCCTAVNERRPRDRGCGRATRRAGAACGRGGGAGRADTAGTWQPARGKRCHRAGELGIDWTEPLPCRSTMAFHRGEAGACESLGRAGRSATRDRRRAGSPKGIAEPSREVGDARRPARADSGRALGARRRHDNGETPAQQRRGVGPGSSAGSTTNCSRPGAR